MTRRRRLIRAGLIADAAGTRAAPGALLLDGDEIVASGRPEEIGAPADADLEDRAASAVFPALVNAHCHLDLSHLGPVPPQEDFAAWVDVIRAGRAGTPGAIAAAVEIGIRLARAGGTALVGDIAGVGSRVPIETQRRERMAGVSFLEVFGIGRGQAAAIERMEAAVGEIGGEGAGVRFGLQPHAPYSCGGDVYRAAAGLGRPLATHLSETLEEIRFVGEAEGPLADLLRRVGAWDDSIVGRRVHPVEAVTAELSGGPVLAAHLNYVETDHLDLLRRCGVTVVYCPRASAYFGHPRGDHPRHRYRAMLDAGITVVLGTDGLPCLDTPDRISILDEMRLLHRRDGADPATLLAMATTHGAHALGFDPALFTLRAGRTAGIIEVPFDAGSTIDAMEQVLRSRAAPRWLLGPLDGADDWRSG